MFVSGFIMIFAIATGFQPVLSAMGCGRASVEPILDDNTNFVEARPHSWPWHVIFCKKDITNCSDSEELQGTLIGPEWLITSIYTAELMNDKYQMLLGTHKKSTSDTDEGVIKRDIAEVYYHPNFSSFNNVNDIGLIKIAGGPITFTEYIRPVCLMTDPQTANIPGNTAYTIGHDAGHSQNEYIMSDPLLQLRSQFVDVSICREISPSYVNENSFCLKLENGYFGEWAAPAFIRNENNQKFYLIGGISPISYPPGPQVFGGSKCDAFITDITGTDICDDSDPVTSPTTSTTTTSLGTREVTTKTTTRSTAGALPTAICIFVQIYNYFARFM